MKIFDKNLHQLPECLPPVKHFLRPRKNPFYRHFWAQGKIAIFNWLPFGHQAW